MVGERRKMTQCHMDGLFFIPLQGKYALICCNGIPGEIDGRTFAEEKWGISRNG